MLPAGHRPATSWVHYTTSCNTQSSAPEDGQNNSPEHVELIGIINKPLLLHLVGCLYYLYQWCAVKHILNYSEVVHSVHSFYIKQFFNTPTKCASLFFVPLSTTSLLHVSVCYIHYFQEEPLIVCTKPSAFYCVFRTLHCCAMEYNTTQYNTYSFVDRQYFFTMIKTTFLLVTLNAKKTFKIHN